VPTRLTDELLDAQDRVIDLEHKLVEYEEVIDSLNHQFEQQQDDYDDMLCFMDQYYTEEVERLAPKFIDKHYVLNRDGKDIECVFISILCDHFFINILCPTTCFYLLSCQASMQSGCHMLTS